MGSHSEHIVLAVVVAFLNEAEHLPTLLGSISTQTRTPDLLVLVDDGSCDGSYELAQEFAQRNSYAIALRRPPRPLQADRLATAAELLAFQWGLEQVDAAFDVVAKLDADLDLSPSHFAVLCSLFERDPALGLAGAYLSERRPDGSIARDPHPVDHIRGANKFYRRACLEEISPLPAYLGWDTIDEVTARMRGWRTASVALPDRDTIHLRPNGAYNGRLRAFWRWGQCAYGLGSHPLNVLAGGIVRMRRKPYVVGGSAYVLGWGSSYLRSRPRAEAAVRTFRRREELRRLRRVVAAGPRKVGSARPVGMQ